MGKSTLCPKHESNLARSSSKLHQRILQLSWYHLERQSYKWRSTEKNRTRTSWEGYSRKKDAMAWSCHENGWSTHSEASATLGSSGEDLADQGWTGEICKEGRPKNGINLGRGWSIGSSRHSWRQRVALCIGDAGWIKVKVKAIYDLYHINTAHEQKLTS